MKEDFEPVLAQLRHGSRQQKLILKSSATETYAVQTVVLANTKADLKDDSGEGVMKARRDVPERL